MSNMLVALKDNRMISSVLQGYLRALAGFAYLTRAVRGVNAAYASTACRVNAAQYLD